MAAYRALHALLVGTTTIAFAQAPNTSPVLGSSAFFQQDPKVVMMACAEKARSIEKKDSRMLAEYGRVYLLAGDRKQAEEAFRLGIKADPKDAETHRLIGYAWLMAGFKAEAIEAFVRMQEADPKAKGAFGKAAVNLVDAGFVEEGELLMLKAVKMDVPYGAPKGWAPPPPSVINGQSSGMGWVPTSEFLKHAIFDGWDSLRFARAALRMKRPDMAARWLQRAAEAKPKEERIWNGIAMALADGGKED